MIENLSMDLEGFKEMEKEQTLDFTRNAVRKILDEDRQNPFNLEQYYNETYGGKNEQWTTNSSRVDETTS